MVDNEFARKRWVRRTSIAFLILIVAVSIGFLEISRHAQQTLRQRAVDMLQDRFDSEVEISDFQVSGFPHIAVKGKGLTLRHLGRRDVPPLLAIREFTAEMSWFGLLGKPWHIRKVEIHGLSLHVAHRQPGAQSPPKQRHKSIPVLVDELIAKDTELVVLPGNPDKLSQVFLIHDLKMEEVGLEHAASFHATLTNSKPPGEIASTGHFGPWQSEDPGQTPLSASYTFKDADLSVFRGIGGTLSSAGNFGGILEEIAIQGETTTPDFVVNIGGHPILLKTKFDATVDGTNGDTLLHPVVASFLRSTLTAEGGVVKAKGGKGRDIVLNVSAADARLEDLLALAIKADQPPMTGSVSLKTRFDLPSGTEEIIDRLELDGQFGVAGAHFTEANVSEKVQSLSRHGLGQPNNINAGSAISNLRGRFTLRHAVITFRDLTFQVDGARVQLRGRYGLRHEYLDFHGKLRLDAKLSQVTTGAKSFLLKPFDHFFRKQGKTEIPIKVTGTRRTPSFGFDLGHKNVTP
jgi:AsmA-like C-terminal region